ncbi:MAG TPA: YdcF family protein [Ilumatobacter sp.]|nr:YdcF family protein [Ilumatobacter sp.]
MSGRKFAALIVLCAAFYYAVNLVLVMAAARSDDTRQVDAIVVLGAAQYDGRPSPQLAARLDHALELWERDVADYVMVTGGKLEGDRFTEAETSRRYLVDAGVPEEAILMEDAGRNTFDSLEAAAHILLADELDEVLLVTDPFHTKRSELIAQEVGLEAWSSPTPTSVVGPWTSARRQMLEAAGISVGRVIGFERLSGLTG